MDKLNPDSNFKLFLYGETGGGIGGYRAGQPGIPGGSGDGNAAVSCAPHKQGGHKNGGGGNTFKVIQEEDVELWIVSVYKVLEVVEELELMQDDKGIFAKLVVVMEVKVQ